jgi:hypothetical protein
MGYRHYNNLYSLYLIQFLRGFIFGQSRVPRLPTGKHKGNKKSRYQDFAKIDLFFHIKKKKKYE